MRYPLRALALACALALTPACASLQLGETRLENPAVAARTLDQRGYALLGAYAALIEESTDIVRDPAVPIAVKRALGQAEAAATPTVETLEIALAAYLRARADFAAAATGAQPALQRAATALDIAARRLGEAVSAADAPIQELEQLVRARGA
jgi:hypothetical protein